MNEEPDVSERSSHNNGLVTVSLVVVVNGTDGDNSGVLLSVVRSSIGLVLLVPIQNSTDKGRDEGNTGLGAGDGLCESEEEGEVAVDTVVSLELSGGLNTFPRRSDLDENSVLVDSELLVERNQLVGLSCRNVSGLQRTKRRCDERTLALVAFLSKESRASTSVETRPGTRARISFPNSTSYDAE